jgi:photosystem I subunit 10
MIAPLLSPVLALAPTTIAWSPKVALVMIAMLGTLSLGHILGIGAIQGLASRGVL